MAYTTIDNPELYFQAKLYTGTGSSHAITLDGSENMQPDWVWTKVRSHADSHSLQDSVRGAGKTIYSDANDAEYTDSTAITSFDSDGYTLGTQGNVNLNTRTFVSWNWKAETSFSNDASATSVGTIDSTGSVNTTAGFSIISYTGTGSVGTVAHGLGVTPKMIIFKNRSTASNWLVYHEDVGNTKNLYLDATNAEHDRSDTFNDTSPTSSVFTVGTADLNTDGHSIIAYCFSEIKGYSKFGSFTGTANTNGPFLYTGFKPAYFLVKNASDGSANWQVWDNKTSPFNEVQAHLYPNTTGAEVTNSGYNNCDFLSNGIKVTEDNGDFNGSGNTVIWMAFAESPFVNSNGIPNNAR